MIELAQFEYAISVIFDEHTADCTLMANETSADEELKLLPVFHLFHHSFPICKYYLEFNQKKEPDLPFPEESFCVVTRHNYRLGLFALKPAQYHFLNMLKELGSVAAALTHLTNTYGFEQAAVDAVWPEWKKFFIASGFFCL